MSDRGIPRRLDVSSSMKALEALGLSAITVRYDRSDDVELHVLVGAHFPRKGSDPLSYDSVFRAGRNLQEALGLVVETAAPPGVLTLAHAANRSEVRLPDGGLGTLIYLDRRAVMATVRTGEGRFRTLPAALLTLASQPTTNEGNSQ